MNKYVAYYQSPPGIILLECSDTHLTTLNFIEEESQLQTSDHSILQETKHQLDEYFNGNRNEFSIPIQQACTPFQENIFRLVSAVPFGKCISYRDLSKQYGDVKSIRAVASANGKNKILIIIPCHRIIGSNGALTGYAGGLWRKKWLLEHEAKMSQQKLF